MALQGVPAGHPKSLKGAPGYLGRMHIELLEQRFGDAQTRCLHSGPVDKIGATYLGVQLTDCMIALVFRQRFQGRHKSIFTKRLHVYVSNIKKVGWMAHKGYSASDR